MIDFSQFLVKAPRAKEEPRSQREESLSFARQFARSKSERMAGESLSGISGPSESLTELSRMPVDVVNLAPESRVVFVSEPRGPGADRFRYLRMCFQQFKDAVRLKTVLITSPQPDDGKSTTAINLATALAEGGKYSVLLIEADLHRPTLAAKLGIKQQPGLAEALESGSDPMASIRRLEPLNWFLLQAGKPKGNPAELVQSDMVQSVIQQCEHHFDWILMDTPPVLPLSDAVSLLRYLDASMLVVRADRTQRQAVEEALTRLGPKHVLGIVLNGAERLNRLYSQYSGYYGKSAIH